MLMMKWWQDAYFVKCGSLNIFIFCADTSTCLPKSHDLIPCAIFAPTVRTNSSRRDNALCFTSVEESVVISLCVAKWIITLSIVLAPSNFNA